MSSLKFVVFILVSLSFRSSRAKSSRVDDKGLRYRQERIELSEETY